MCCYLDPIIVEYSHKKNNENNGVKTEWHSLKNQYSNVQWHLLLALEAEISFWDSEIKWKENNTSMNDNEQYSSPLIDLNHQKKQYRASAFRDSRVRPWKTKKCSIVTFLRLLIFLYSIGIFLKRNNFLVYGVSQVLDVVRVHLGVGIQGFRIIIFRLLLGLLPTLRAKQLSGRKHDTYAQYVQFQSIHLKPTKITKNCRLTCPKGVKTKHFLTGKYLFTDIEYNFLVVQKPVMVVHVWL